MKAKKFNYYMERLERPYGDPFLLLIPSVGPCDKVVPGQHSLIFIHLLFT